MVGEISSPHAVQMRSNDYLCIANDPQIVEAEIAMLRQTGHGGAISRVFLGREEDLHRAFERRIARLTGAQDAVLCMSGYCANMGLLQTIATEGTQVYIDIRAHASLWQGIACARATPRPLAHRDVQDLDRKARMHGPGILVVDALYSTDGALCPLLDMVAVAEKHGLVIVVDETHSFGTQGPRGEGLVPALGLAERVHFRTIGLSKAVPSRGGVILASARNAEFLRFEMFPIIFSTSVLPHEVAGFHAALDIIETERFRRDRLAENHRRLRLALDGLGYNVDACDAQIIALEAGPLSEIVKLRQALERRHVIGSVFCWPATPKDRTLLRLTANAGLSDEQIEHVIGACRDIRDEVGMASWESVRRRTGVNRASP